MSELRIERVQELVPCHKIELREIEDQNGVTQKYIFVDDGKAKALWQDSIAEMLTKIHNIDGGEELAQAIAAEIRFEIAIHEGKTEAEAVKLAYGY